MLRILAVSATIAVALISGCVSPFRGSPPTTTTPTTGKLYVSTPTSILRFGSALTANGNIAPEATVTGSATLLSSPRRILIDTSTNRLFVANTGGASILIFANASTMNGNAGPIAVLTSTSNIVSPVDVAIDSTNNLLYVADGQNILVFSGQSTFSGNLNTPPVRVVNFTFTVGPIFLDAAANTLFIADSAHNAVDIMPSASTANGPGAILISPIAGSATQLNLPNGIALDKGGRVVVSNAGSPASITIFPAATVPGGGPGAPSAVITGSSTRLTAPGEMAVNSNTGDLYVADTQTPGVLIYQNVGAVNGTTNLAPGRTIVGSGTTLNTNAVNGLALDITR
jgi:hypothetical protein